MSSERTCRCFAGAIAVPAGFDAAPPRVTPFSAAAVPTGFSRCVPVCEGCALVFAPDCGEGAAGNCCSCGCIGLGDCGACGLRVGLCGPADGSGFTPLKRGSLVLP